MQLTCRLFRTRNSAGRFRDHDSRWCASIWYQREHWVWGLEQLERWLTFPTSPTRATSRTPIQTTLGHYNVNSRGITSHCITFHHPIPSHPGYHSTGGKAKPD